MHVNRATYTYYELGKTQPDFQQLEKIAQVFGVNLETLSRILVDPESTHSWEVVGESADKGRSPARNPEPAHGRGKIPHRAVPAVR